MITQKKLVLGSVQNVELIGLLADSESMTLKLTKERVQKVLTFYKTTFLYQEISILQLARLLDHLSFTTPAVIPAHLTTASLSPKKEHVIQQENKSGKNVSNKGKMFDR